MTTKATDGTTASPDGTTPAGTTPAAATTTTTTTVAEPGKAGTDAAAAAAAAAAATTTQTGAPEKYTLTAPEDGGIDAADLKLVEEVARENDWTNEQAQDALERHAATRVEQSARFLAETTADKDYGGTNLATTQARAKAIIDSVRPATHPRAAAFRALLDRSGFGNNIEVISFLADLAKRTEEDGAIGSNASGATAKKSAEDTLYDGK